MSILTMSTLGLESCPRCRGNMMFDEDHYGRYELCIQCGYLYDLEDATKVDKRSVREARRNMPGTVKRQN
ncbi:hypothetical protein ACFLV5_00755 [Chloroflexota bacterium]